MFSLPKAERGLRSRVVRYRASLTEEKRRYGGIDDGAGTRYVIFWLLFLLNDPAESKKYIRWYKKEFAGDIGEPIQKLCLALMQYRMGDIPEANYTLADLMLANQYFIPALTGGSFGIETHRVSNYGSVSYIEAIPPEIVQAISPLERDWMKARYESLVFRRLRKRYTEIEEELEKTEGIEKRQPLVRELFGLLEKHRSEITANQPMERTPPRCAPRRRSSAR